MEVKTRVKYPAKVRAVVRITADTRRWMDELIEAQEGITDSDIVRDALDLYNKTRERRKSR